MGRLKRPDDRSAVVSIPRPTRQSAQHIAIRPKPTSRSAGLRRRRSRTPRIGSARRRVERGTVPQYVRRAGWRETRPSRLALFVARVETRLRHAVSHAGEPSKPARDAWMPNAVARCARRPRPSRFFERSDCGDTRTVVMLDRRKTCSRTPRPRSLRTPELRRAASTIASACHAEPSSRRMWAIRSTRPLRTIPSAPTPDMRSKNVASSTNAEASSTDSSETAGGKPISSTTWTTRATTRPCAPTDPT